MNKKSVIAALGLICIGIIFGALLVSGLKSVDPGYAEKQVPVKLETQTNQSKNVPDLKSVNDAFVAIAKKVTPTVVSVTVTTKAREGRSRIPEFFHFFGPEFRFEFPRPGPQQGSGSGVILTPDGYIITNNHVVDKADKNRIEVTLSDTRRFEARLVGTDPTTDLAILKIDAKDLPAAALGNSDDLQVGQWVLAIGSPFGYLSSTVTAGIISYLGRNINIMRDDSGIENFIQTDAAINPGNSGGALVNLNGEVIGINTAIATRTGTYEGYGFAIPINLAKKVAEDIINTGRVRRGYLGIMITTVDATVAKAKGLEKARGVLVQSITEGSAAGAAGVIEGDIILAVDGKEVNAASELQTMIARKHPGDTVTLTIYRDGKRIEKKVTLKERAPGQELASKRGRTDEESSDETNSSKTITLDNLGLTVKDIPASVRKELKVENGVQIAEVKTFSEAYNRQLRAGDVIIEADKKKIDSVTDLKRVIESRKPGDAIMLRIKDRDGNLRFVAVQIPKEHG